jgi:hypothetical protein
MKFININQISNQNQKSNNNQINFQIMSTNMKN